MYVAEEEEDPRTEVLDGLARAARRAMRARIGQIDLLEGDAGLVAAGISPRTQAPLVAATLCAATLSSREVLLVPDALAVPELRADPLIARGLRSFLGAPLLDPAGEPLGVLFVLDAVPRTWTAQDAARIADLALVAAAAVRRAALIA